MRYQITGKQIDIGEALQTHVKQELNVVVGKYAERPTDLCAEKMEKQLRRYKRRLKNHHHERTEPVALSGASSYILASSDDVDVEEPDTLQPITIAEMATNVPSLSVGEAVMQLELGSAPVLVFRNEGRGRINVVYRREDGNIGWVDPS